MTLVMTHNEVFKLCLRNKIPMSYLDFREALQRDQFVCGVAAYA